MSVLPSPQSLADPESAKQQRDIEIEKAGRICEELTRLMDETLVSLLYCYKEEPSGKRCGFPASVSQESQNGKSAIISPRDTAIVLSAILTAGQEIMDLTPTQDDHEDSKQKISKKRTEFIKRLRKRQSHSGAEPIQRHEFLNLFFVPCVRNLLRRGNNPLVNLKNSASAPESSEDRIRNCRDPFSLARILGLLNLYTREETHESLYVDAVAEVVGALCKTFGPNYAFGGASLTKTEPHAFVSYYCLNSLTGVREIMENRALEHEDLALLLEDLAECVDGASATYLRYGGWKGLKDRLPREIERLRNGVGILAIVRTIKNYLKNLKKGHDLDPRVLSNEIKKAIKESVDKKDAWLVKFQRAIGKEIKNVKVSVGGNLEKLSKSTDNKESIPGRASMKTAELYMKGAAHRWELAFFEGMEYVLNQTKEAYRPLNNRTDLKKLSEAVRKVGKVWLESAARTKDYICIFTKWATAELQRQLSFSHIRYQTNFDPVQLAFLLRIDNDLSPGKNPQLTLKGLEILFDSQQRDGMWPVGAPLFFEPQIGRAVYVANLEIVNAVLPLVKEHDKIDLYWENLERVLNWLRTNKKEIQLDLNANDLGEAMRVPIHGWATEKVPERGRIDVWLTALALEFLDAYRDILMEFVNCATVRHKYDRQTAKDLLEWDKLVDPQLSKPYGNRVTTKIYEEYILPFRQVGMSRKNAMILYGPPGTGKSSIAEAIAKELDWSLVTITPSDFVKEGIEKSEYMARTLFNDLTSLQNTVILFDEIDEMLRSRSEEEGEKRDQNGVAMLQFIVPGMLPKLQRLKKYGERHGVIVVIATNYFERLDSAVKRRGRIDDYFAIYPPDGPSRQLFLYTSLRKVLPTDNAGQRQEYMEFAKKLSCFTQGWAFTELDRLVRFILKSLIIDGRITWTEFMGDWKDRKWRNENIRPVDPRDKSGLFTKGYCFVEIDEKRSLNPLRVYGRRKEASDEARDVFEICRGGIEFTEAEFKSLLEETL